MFDCSIRSLSTVSREHLPRIKLNNIGLKFLNFSLRGHPAPNDVTERCKNSTVGVGDAPTCPPPPIADGGRHCYFDAEVDKWQPRAGERVFARSSRSAARTIQFVNVRGRARTAVIVVPPYFAIIASVFCTPLRGLIGGRLLLSFVCVCRRFVKTFFEKKKPRRLAKSSRPRIMTA